MRIKISSYMEGVLGALKSLDVDIRVKQAALQHLENMALSEEEKLLLSMKSNPNILAELDVSPTAAPPPENTDSIASYLGL